MTTMKNKIASADLILSGTDLSQMWVIGSRMEYDGVSYRVGRMSYGDYFLEPGHTKGERFPFNGGTLWMEKFDAKTDLFRINREAN